MLAAVWPNGHDLAALSTVELVDATIDAFYPPLSAG
jgi:hypothetical protein